MLARVRGASGEVSGEGNGATRALDVADLVACTVGLVLGGKEFGGLDCGQADEEETWMVRPCGPH